MKHAKKILSIIAAVVLVMTTGVHVALGEPTPTVTTAESPSSSETPDTTETDSTPQTTFVLMEVNSVGENVIRLQMRLRQLGYFNYRATGMYYSMTQKGVKQFQENNELSADGQAGEATYTEMFTVDAVRKSLPPSVLYEVGLSDSLDTHIHGELSSWAEIDPLFTMGMTVTITDYNTGKTFEMTRSGGVNHADVESKDSDSYKTFKECFGGEDNWSEKRAVLVTINGVQYAASLFGHPSGEDTISDNGMAGHTQLYFNGSTSDIFGFTDRYHQDKVLTAAGQ
jgi:peptidoglycan hydrolase-like protein with peptidoglycan-binding domain